MKQVKIRNIYYPDPSINWNFQYENPEAKIQELIDSQIIGLPERIVEQVSCSEEQLANALELIPEVVGEDGVLISPAMVKLPQDYIIEVEDITAQVEQEKINQEALDYLASTDWLIIREVDSGIACSAEIKQLRQAARDSIIR